MAIKNLGIGSSGDDVVKLQNALIEAGYDVGGTGADGILGKNTAAAIKQYQKDNGLQVDGIAGKNTQGLLYGSGSNNSNAGANTNAGSNNAGAGSQQPAAEAPKVETPTVSGDGSITMPSGYTLDPFEHEEFTVAPREKSDIEIQAEAMLAEKMANAPGAWSDPYKDQYMGYLNQYANRDPFSYDFNSDALYQQYKDQYIQQGRMAMMDTMGQAAAMTGGYGNSYAQTVGQQAYNQQLNQLNEMIPELYDRAYNRYNQEGQNLLNMYNAYLGLSEKEYNQYLGNVDRYYKELDATRNYANDVYEKNYGEWYDKTKMDFDTWSANTGLDFDEWKTTQGLLSDEWQTVSNQNFQATENQKDRDLTVSENDKKIAESNKASAKSDLIDLITATGYSPTDAELAEAGMTRSQADGYTKAYTDAAAAKAAEAVPYGTLNTTDTMTWIKKFEGAQDLETLETYATALQGIIGPEAAALWYDMYAKKFKDKGKNEDDVIITPAHGNGGTAYYQAW